MLVLAFGLRLYEVSYREVEGDEAGSYARSLLPLSQIVETTLSTGEPHPVGSYFLLHGWMRLGGATEFAFRFPSVWFGALAVAVLYRLARRVTAGGPPALDAAPLLAAVCGALSPLLVLESRSARMYSESLALSALSTWLAVELLMPTAPWAPGPHSSAAHGQRPRLVFGAYVLCSWLALNVHYFAGVVLLAHNVFAAVLLMVTPGPGRRALLVRWSLAQLAVLAAFLPWFMSVRAALASYQGLGLTPPTPWWVGERMARALVVGGQARGAPEWLWLLAVAAAGVGLARLWLAGPGPRLGALLCLGLIVTPWAVAYADGHARNTFTERQIIATALGFFPLVAAGAAFAWSGPARLGRSPAIRPRHTEAEAGAPDRAPAAGSRPAWVKLPTNALLGLAPAALAAAVLTAMGLGLREYYAQVLSQPTPWRTIAQLIDRYAAGVPPEQFRVAQDLPEPGLSYYYRTPPGPIVLVPRPNDLDAAMRIVRELAEAGVQRLAVRLERQSWWNGEPERNVARMALASQYALLYERMTGRGWLQVWGRAPAQALAPVGASFQNGLRLEGALVRGVGPLRAGTPEQRLEVHTRWTGDPSALAGTEKLFIHVTDASGRIVSQLDLPFEPGDLEAGARAYAVPLAESLPPGEYQVRLGLYDPGRPGAPRLLSGAGTDWIELDDIALR